MKTNKTEGINEFIAFHYSQKKSYSEIQNLVKSKFGIDISYDSVRKRIKKGGASKVLNTFEKDLSENNFSGDWKHGWLKTETSSIFIKNDQGDDMTYEDIRLDLIAEMKRYAPKYPAIKRTKGAKHMILVDPADVHFQKLSVSEETGYEYNLSIAEKRFNEGVDSLLNKSMVYDIHSIVLILGNDMLHTDNPFRKTTAGTAQDTDGMWWQAFQVAKRCYIKAIEKMLTVADVKLVFCPSNHDYTHGYMLADSIISWFNKNKNVSSFATMAHRKYVKYGQNMIGLTHGDGAKNEDLPNLMLMETRGQPFKFGYFITHHGHRKDRRVKILGDKKMSQLEKDSFVTLLDTGVNYDPTNSITVEMVRTPSAPDGWHDRNGYVNMQAMEAFVFHESMGQVARLTHYY